MRCSNNVAIYFPTTEIGTKNSNKEVLNQLVYINGTFFKLNNKSGLSLHGCVNPEERSFDIFIVMP